MNTIGIAIKRTINGSEDPLIINEGEWNNYVVDVRPLLTKVNGMKEENQILRILSFTEEGCLLTLVRKIAGRGGDNIAAWIFIPATIEISGKETRYVMDTTEHAILASTLDTTELERICKHSFPSSGNTICKSSAGEKIAYKYYNDAMLNDILGPYRYQKYYDDYRYIFLFDSNSGISLANPQDGTDLSAYTNERPSILIPPTSKALREHFGYDVQLQFIDGKPFDKPAYLKKDNSIELMFVRKDFLPVIYPFTKTTQAIDQQFPLKLIKATDLNWQKPFSYTDISFYNEENEPIKNIITESFQIKVNNTDLRANEEIGIDERAVKRSTIEIISGSPTYQSVINETVDLTVRPVKVVIPYCRENKTVKIVTQDGSEADLDYQVKCSTKDNDSPIKGYVFDRHGRLVYDSFRPNKYRIQGFLGSAAIAIACLLFIWIYYKNESIHQSAKSYSAIQSPEHPYSDCQFVDQAELPDVNESQTQNIEEAQSEETSNMQEFTYEQAIEYLDDNKVWKRSEMEQYPTLQGLFDDMNKYRLLDLTEKWRQKLNLSTKFKKVAEVASKNIRKGRNPASGKHAPCYNKPNDEAISVLNYINWLDQKKTEPDNSQNKNIE